MSKKQTALWRLAAIAIGLTLVILVAVGRMLAIDEEKRNQERAERDRRVRRIGIIEQNERMEELGIPTTCDACKRTVDARATVCPHCRSELY